VQLRVVNLLERLHDLFVANRFHSFLPYKNYRVIRSIMSTQGPN
jgi:hypothetical protein